MRVRMRRSASRPTRSGRQYQVAQSRSHGCSLSAVGRAQRPICGEHRFADHRSPFAIWTPDCTFDVN